MINYDLARQQNLSPEIIAKLEVLHQYRDHLEAERLEGRINRNVFLSLWTANEYKLQELWGFPKSSAYHRFWDAEGCTCPRLDNDDAYPTGYYVINETCPLHGINSDNSTNRC